MLIMEMLRAMPFVFLAALVITTLVHAQDGQPAGFISIDCGAAEDYTASPSMLNYVTDTAFRETGVTASITSGITATLAQQLKTLRSFPNGTRDCYTVKPSTLATSKYLIRARFMYGNYDGLNILPKFDLYLGPNIWATVEFTNPNISVGLEIIVNITSIYTSICLVNTGSGTPFISALELRPITVPIYEPKYGSLLLISRLDLGSSLTHVIRYKDDIFDRLWVPFSWPEVQPINTSLTINTKNDYQPPSIVMETAATPKNVSGTIDFYFDSKDSTTEYYIYMHFAEVEILQPNQTREFSITLNGSQWYSSLRPTYLVTNTLYSPAPQSGFDKFEFSLIRTKNSTLPPTMNALEIYEVNRVFQKPTSQGEVDAMKNIKARYGVKRNWQGDPCAPQKYTWDGLNCTFSGYDPPNITYLNLSSWGLTGEIPLFIANLQSLQILDLSNNNLSGPVPGFLTQLTSLTVLNLASNNLSGSVPVDLIKRSSGGSLSLSVNKNVDLCASTSCTKEGESNKNSSNAVVPIVASTAGVIIFILLVALAILFRRRKKNPEGMDSKMMYDNRYSNREDQSKFEAKNRLVTYSDVQSMTNNFATVIGRGGFGTVYLGMLDGAQVAVKLLSPSSAQGYKEFHAEVKLLMMVHHKNLTTLVGYCDDSNNKALIYECMVNGNLAAHLSDRSPNVLNWQERLQIAVDSAQGLEYLHKGCKPPIVHRDVKTTNILLNDAFRAKISDFGLSRAFPAEGSTHVSTKVAGTPGYLDPEYYVSDRLSEKSDVFSFGVVLLEIISSRAVITRNQETGHISQWVSNILEREGDVRRVVDSRLDGDFDVNSAWKAVEVAMACVSATSLTRPSMTEVVMELKDCLAMEMSRMNSRETVSSHSTDMAYLSIDSGLIPLAR